MDFKRIDFSNRYVKLTLLTALLTVLFYALEWIIFSAIGVPVSINIVQLMITALAASLVVYRYFADQIQ